MRKFIKSVGYALNGIRVGFTGRNFKIQLVSAAGTIFSGFFFQITLLEWTILVLSISIILGAELMNTAIEKLCDKFHPDQNPEIGIIKDLAAGSVVMLSIGSLVIAFLVFGWRIYFFIL